LLTVLIETDDFAFKLVTIIATALNGTITLQFLLYWNSSKKVEPVKGAGKTQVKETKKNK